MQYAAEAASYLHLLAQQLLKPSRANAEASRSALTTRGAAQSLVQLLLWLSEPTTAAATASGVLQEALPALQLMAAGEEMRQLLAAEGGPHEWEPAAAALRRRLPRRMAARFLPDLDRVSAAVARPQGLLLAKLLSTLPLSPLPRPLWLHCCRCVLWCHFVIHTRKLP